MLDSFAMLWRRLVEDGTTTETEYLNTAVVAAEETRRSGFWGGVDIGAGHVERSAGGLESGSADPPSMVGALRWGSVTTILWAETGP